MEKNAVGGGLTGTYSTYDEDGDSTDQEAQQLADDAREDIELSLSNSEDNDSESEESASDLWVC